VMGLAFGQEIYQKSIMKIVQNQQYGFLKDFETIFKRFLAKQSEKNSSQTINE
jgi:hypothetical protein